MNIPPNPRKPPWAFQSPLGRALPAIDLHRWRDLATALLRDVREGELSLWASSLAYTTLLSLAPLLAVSFSVLTAFGAQNQMRPFLLELLMPLGPNAPELADRVIGFVNNLNVGVLGFSGFALLFYTVLSLLQKIEDSFNHVWQVKKSRSLRRRYAEYLSVLLVGPVLVFSVLGIVASMTRLPVVENVLSIEPVGSVYHFLGRVLSTGSTIVVFTMLYLWVPNTRIRFKAAAIGGLAAGTGWHLAGWAFARLVAGSTQYAAIYSSFAILVVFIIWLYVIWLVLLLGVDICYYVQNRACSRDSASYRSPGWRMLRHTGLTVAYLIGDRFRQGGPPWTVADLASRLELPQAAIESVLERLRDRRILLAIDLDETAYLPARGLDTILVADILAALGGDANGTRRLACSISAVDALVARLEEARERALQELSWQALLEAPSEATTQQQ